MRLQWHLQVLAEVSLKPAVTKSQAFQYKDVLFSKQKTVTVADCHYNRWPLYVIIIAWITSTAQ